MSIIESITLFGIMVALAAMPSASVALVVTRSAMLGIANGLAVSAGIVVGDLVFIILSIFGLSLIAETLGGLFMVVKVLGGLYLLWLGFSLSKANNSTKITVDKNRDKSSLVASFLAGFLLTLGDIKAIVFANKVSAYAQNMKMENTARKTAGGLMLGAGSYLIVKA